MTDTFNSCKDAVAYAMAHARGPRAARPSYGQGPKGYRSAWDGCAVRACMVRAGIAKGSPEERAIEDWACKGGEKPVKLERALRRELDDAELLKRPTTELTRRRDLAVVTWVDSDTGAEVETRSLAREDDEG